MKFNKGLRCCQLVKYAQFSRLFSQVAAKTKNDKWESVIGLEIHAQISSTSKLFSGSSTAFIARPNSQVSLFDCAMPGTLPVLNATCVENAVKTALALGCKINRVSSFDRKHYFYADMPAGYQITQQRSPIASDGKLEFVVYNSSVHKKAYYHASKIKQLQLEQDSGKSLHDVHEDRSLVDLNRAGMPLMEIVFEPDLRDGEEAAALVKELTLIIRLLGTCDCKMEEGSLRVDANISVNKRGEGLGVRTEVKNLNSMRSIAKAVDYEVSRQIALLDKGIPIENETMTYDVSSKKTVSLRDKEKVQDYRFMPEPNLPPLVLELDGDVPGNSISMNLKHLKHIKTQLPSEIRNRMVQEHNVSLEYATILVNDDELIAIYNAIVARPGVGYTPLTVVKFLLNDFYFQLNKRELTAAQTCVSADQISDILEAVRKNELTKIAASEILDLLFDRNNPSITVKQIVDEKGWVKITDDSAIIANIATKVIAENPKMVAKYIAGKKRELVLGKLVKLVSEDIKYTVDMRNIANHVRSKMEELESQNKSKAA